MYALSQITEIQFSCVLVVMLVDCHLFNRGWAFEKIMKLLGVTNIHFPLGSDINISSTAS